MTDAPIERPPVAPDVEAFFAGQDLSSVPTWQTAEELSAISVEAHRNQHAAEPVGAKTTDLVPTPNGCRWCGAEKRMHYQQWHPDVGRHGWAEPTDEQRLERMLARAPRDEENRR